MRDRLLAELLAEIDSLADDLVENWLSPDECASRLSGVVENYVGSLSDRAKKCLDDLKSLQDVIHSEKSTPDVVQEYLFYIIQHFAEK